MNMETIEERAKEYANILGATLFMDSPEEDIIYRDDLARAYASGAKEERAELTRWHDPKEELPEERRDVEVKTDKGTVSVCNMELDELGRRFWNVSRTNYMIPDANILGWREIHE